MSALRDENFRSSDVLPHGLAGRWAIARIFEGAGATLEGVASFLPDGPGALLYRESGQLTLADGRALQAARSYRYRFLAGAVAIDFADGSDKGRLFVRLAFGPSATAQAEASAIHHCGADVYRVLYRLSLPSAFETDIAVSGPNKAYRAISRYRRLG
ncbi:DUF6314 family protein [Methylocapsa sp. S129]|uniref:DUF6314 family protein n=1 Tax=Methylocapsa sp. S129 TaxID=1641869 RepID=UPI001FF00173|nr:DUF6314 family protein [Methylocapsa sp. S129]